MTPILQVPSKSRPDIIYNLYFDGEFWICDCPGYLSKGRRYCVHTIPLNDHGFIPYSAPAWDDQERL